MCPWYGHSEQGDHHVDECGFPITSHVPKVSAWDKQISAWDRFGRSYKNLVETLMWGESLDSITAQAQLSQRQAARRRHEELIRDTKRDLRWQCLLGTMIILFAVGAVVLFLQIIRFATGL